MSDEKLQRIVSWMWLVLWAGTIIGWFVFGAVTS